MAYNSDLADRLRDVLAGQPGLSEKRMFGGLAFLLSGHMAVAVTGQGGGLMVRIHPDRADELLADPRADRMVMRDRELKGWLLVDVDGTTDAELERWVEAGVEFVRRLPPK